MIFARVVLRVSCGYVYIYIIIHLTHILWIPGWLLHVFHSVSRVSSGWTHISYTSWRCFGIVLEGLKHRCWSSWFWLKIPSTNFWDQKARQMEPDGGTATKWATKILRWTDKPPTYIWAGKANRMEQAPGILLGVRFFKNRMFVGYDYCKWYSMFVGYSPYFWDISPEYLQDLFHSCWPYIVVILTCLWYTILSSFIKLSYHRILESVYAPTVYEWIIPHGCGHPGLASRSRTRMKHIHHTHVGDMSHCIPRNINVPHEISHCIPSVIYIHIYTYI